MTLKKTVAHVLILIIAISASGCVYLRLYQVKRQLRDFEENFRLDDENGLTMEFIHPVLLDKDIVWLMKNEPSSRVTKGDGESWVYILEKQYISKNEEENYDIPISMSFRNGKLLEITFPDRFLKYLSKPLLIKMFSSMGDANINKLSKRADSIFKGNNPSEIPKMKYILYVLGKPYTTEGANDRTRFKYLYRLKNSDKETAPDEFKFESIFSFRNGDESLEIAEFNIRGLKMSLNFSVEEDNLENEIK